MTLRGHLCSAAAAKSLQSCLTLCTPIDGSPPGSPIPGILQARTLEWVAISFSNAWKWKVKVKLAQSCPTLSDPMDCSLPGSSIHGIFQARVLEWGAIAFSNLCSTDEKVETSFWSRSQLGGAKSLVQNKLSIIMDPFSSDTGLSSTLVQLYCFICKV